MNQQNIHVFLAIAENQSISAAARKLHFSQQTVSEHLAQLEKKLGLQLVLRDRGSRSITLTPAGSAFLPLARQHAELEIQVKNLVQSQTQNVLRLGSSINGHQHIVSHIMYKLLRARPELNMQASVIEYGSLNTTNALDNAQFDAIFSFGPKVYEHAHYRPIRLFEEDRYILCPADTSLPDRVLTADDLDPHFEVRYSSFHDSRDSHAWRAQYSPDDVKPYSQVSRLSLAHQYMTDPRCWMVASASHAVALVRLNPEQLTLRQMSPAPPRRMCTVYLSRFYPGKGIIQELLRCCGEYAEETPYLHPVCEDSDVSGSDVPV